MKRLVCELGNRCGQDCETGRQSIRLDATAANLADEEEAAVMEGTDNALPEPSALGNSVFLDYPRGRRRGGRGGRRRRHGAGGAGGGVGARASLHLLRRPRPYRLGLGLLCRSHLRKCFYSCLKQRRGKQATATVLARISPISD